MKNLILIFLLTISTSASATTLNSFLPTNLIQNSEFGNQNLIKKYKLELKDTTHFTMSFLDEPGFHFDLDVQLNIDEFIAGSQTKNFEALIKMAYSDKPSPYAGIISNSTKCKKEFFPKSSTVKINGEEYKIISSAAGSRFQLGICENKEATYEVCSLIKYYPKQQFILKLKHYTPYKKVSCKDGVIKFLKGLQLK